MSKNEKTIKEALLKGERVTVEPKNVEDYFEVRDADNDRVDDIDDRDKIGNNDLK